MKTTYPLLSIYWRENRESQELNRFLLDVNQKGYCVKEYIATHVELNTHILSTLKYAKSIWSMNTGTNFYTSMFGSLGILVGLAKCQTEMGFIFCQTFMGPLFAIICNLEMDT